MSEAWISEPYLFGSCFHCIFAYEKDRKLYCVLHGEPKKRCKDFTPVFGKKEEKVKN